MAKKLLCTNWWLTDARSRYVKETIPYIRKDALVEWLENKVSLSYGVATDTLVEVIDKLNSL